MISLSALKARAQAEHPDAELAYIPAEKGHTTLFGQRLAHVRHAGVRAEQGDREHFYWANGDVGMRQNAISGTVYRRPGEDPVASLSALGTRPPLWRPHWTAAQRQHEAPPSVPNDLPTWHKPA